jgi:hypothetical protein
MAWTVKHNVLFGTAECFIFVIYFYRQLEKSHASETLLSNQITEIGVNASFLSSDSQSTNLHFSSAVFLI